MMPSHELPEAIGPYRPLERIGEGGSGVVYLARHDGRMLAVKVLNAYPNGMTESLMVRLRREVEIMWRMQRVDSPYVAEIVDFDLGCRPPYIVTRYVQGLPLRDLISQDGPLGQDQLLRLARGMAEALDAIHASGCVHRDLKPSNVMVEGEDPVVIDFGIAHEIDATRVTRAGASGTVGYMAPELISGGPADPPVDVFAWAATVAYACTGLPAFPGENEAAVHHRILSGEPDLGGVPGRLSELLAKALARDPADRPTAPKLLARLAELEPRQGADERVRVELDLVEAVSGAVRELDGGRRIEIPAGVKTGAEIRAPGQGGPGVNGGSPGDLYLDIVVRPQPSGNNEAPGETDEPPPRWAIWVWAGVGGGIGVGAGLIVHWLGT